MKNKFYLSSVNSNEDKENSNSKIIMSLEVNKSNIIY